jgi:hypothetical protein
MAHKLFQLGQKAVIERDGWASAANGAVYLAYRCRHRSGDVQLSDEHAFHCWIDPADYTELDSDSFAFNALKQYAEREGDLSPA